jgi:hypothetical protein
MRYAVEYESSSGTVGLILFSAKDLNAAQIYVEGLITYYGHTHVFNLNELTEGTVAELFRLYPLHSQCHGDT